MGGCTIKGCCNRSEKGFKMFKRPVNSKRQEIWNNYIRNNGHYWEIPKTVFLCSSHFESSIDKYGNKIYSPNPSIPFKPRKDHTNEKLENGLALKRKLILDRREKSKQDAERKKVRSAQLNRTNQELTKKMSLDSEYESELMLLDEESDGMDVEVDPIIKLDGPENSEVIKIVNINDILNPTKESETNLEIKKEKESDLSSIKNATQSSSSSQATPAPKSVKIIKIDPKTLKVLKVSKVIQDPAVNSQSQKPSSSEIKTLNSVAQPEQFEIKQEAELDIESSSDSDDMKMIPSKNLFKLSRSKRTVETARRSLKSILASKTTTPKFITKPEPAKKIAYTVTVKSNPIVLQNNDPSTSFEEVTIDGDEKENSDDSQELEDENSDEDMLSNVHSCDESTDSQTSTKEEPEVENDNFNNQNSLHKCLVCSDLFEYKSELILHQLQHNKTFKSITTEPEPGKLSIRLMRAKDSGFERLIVANHVESTSTPSQSNPRSIVLAINLHSASTPNKPSTESRIKLNCFKYKSFYKCKECDFQDSSVHVMTTHALDHRNGIYKKFSCGICKHVSKNEKDYHKHKLQHKKTYHCPRSCNYSTDFKYELIRHMQFHQKTAEKINRRAKCYHCNVVYSSQDALLKHIREAHNLTLEVLNNSRQKPRPTSEHPQENSYKCLECNFSSNSMTEMTEHTNQHKTIQCPSCNFTTDYLSVMARHSLIHTPEFVSIKKGNELAQNIRNGSKFENQCRTCQLNFQNKELLNRHILAAHVKVQKEEKCQIYEAEIVDEITIEEEIVG